MLDRSEALWRVQDMWKINMYVSSEWIRIPLFQETCYSELSS